MFKIKIASDVPARKQPVFLGAPDNTYPDLVFTTDFSKDVIIPMNSIVLRTALLNSAIFLEQYLKIKVIDLAGVQVEKEIKKEVVKELKPKKKKTVGEVEWK